MNEGNFPGFSAGRPVELYLPEIIHEETLQAAGAFDIQGIPLLYDKFEMECRLKSSVAAAEDIPRMFFNGDTTDANYSSELHTVLNVSHRINRFDYPYIGECAGSTAAAENAYFFCIVMLRPQVPGIGRDAVVTSYGRSGTGNHRLGLCSPNWENTAPITRIQIRTDNHPTDLFVAGSSVRLLGWRRFRLQP